MSRSSSAALLIVLLFSSNSMGDEPVIAEADRTPAASSSYSDSEARSVETDRETKIRELRDQEVNQIRIALGRRLPESRRADLYYRLAELYLEAYRAEFLIEGRIHEKHVASGRRGGTILRGRSRPYLSNGIRACKEILDLKIRYEKMDRILYFLAFNYGEMGNRKQSLRYYQQLTSRHPDSPFVAQGYRELGDAAFRSNRFRESQGYYEQAARRASKSDIYPEVLHKLAWCYYRTRQYDRAVDTMKRAISASSENREKFLSIREEALRDMAIFMTERGKVDEAIEYFGEVAGGKDYYSSVLERLGREYERSVQTEKAIQVYESLIKTHPEEEASFRVLFKLVELDLKKKNYDAALARLRKGKLISSGSDETETAFLNLKALVRRTATEHHESYRKKKRRADLKVAEEYYELYLDRFVGEDDKKGERPEIQMYLAEVKREAGQPATASKLYQTVLESSDKRYAKEAGALWVGSLSEALKSAAKSKSRGRSGNASELERQFVDASDRLAAALPNTAEARGSSLQSAQILAGYSSSREEAEKRVSALVESNPGSPEARTAARLWIQIHSDRLGEPGKGDSGDYLSRAKDLESVLDRISENRALIDADRRHSKGALSKLVNEQRHRIRVSRIAINEKNNDFTAAAQGYVEFSRVAETPTLREQALENAIGAYGRAREFEEMRKLATEWLDRDTRSKGAVRAVRNAATLLLIEGDFAGAAQLFRKLGASGADSDGLLTAARIHEGMEEALQARDAWSGYVEKYSKSAAAGSVLLSLARSYDEGGKALEAKAYYEKCMREEHVIAAECHARLADLYLRVKDEREARRLYAKAAELRPPRRKPISPYVGYARYKMTELDELAASLDPLEFPESRLKASLQKRQAFFVRLTRGYLRAVDAGGPWGVAALHRLASWTAGFADEVDRIAPPSKMDEKQLKEFRKTLSSVSGPLRKEAVSTWKKAYDRASASEIYSPALPEVADSLADLKVPQAHRAQGFRGGFRLAGVPADGGEEGRSEAYSRVRSKLRASARDASAWVDYGNLMWGEGKPLLARLAYDRALDLDSKNVSALNNRAVILLSGSGEEEWTSVAQAAALLSEALEKERLFTASLMNRATLLNYYRMFGAARPLWEQVLARTKAADAYDGLATALFGIGKRAEALVELGKAEAMGASSDRFARVYHEAAAQSVRSGDGPSDCVSRASDADGDRAGGFARASLLRLASVCARWKELRE